MKAEIVAEDRHLACLGRQASWPVGSRGSHYSQQARSLAAETIWKIILQ